jgi:hypothetical protein
MSSILIDINYQNYQDAIVRANNLHAMPII